MSSILYYISGHGYGHAVRSAQVVRALLKARPGLKVHVRTTAPQWLFPRAADCSRQSLDVGLVQRDSLDMDLQATLRACQALYRDAENLTQQEVAFVKRNAISLVVADIPPLAFEIAARARVPSVGISNFSWDVIYQGYVGDYPDFKPLVEQIASYHNQTSLLLTLPYPCPMHAFPRQEAIPWIARPPRIDRAKARAQFGLPQSATIVLLSFGGLGLERLPWDKLKAQSELFFLATGNAKREDGNVMILPDTQRYYEGLLSAIDVLVTKPGYGIVADVLSQRVPMLYTDRGDFAEYEYLVQALRECAHAAYIPQTELLAGNIAPYTTALLNKPPHWPTVGLNGAAVAARKILDMYDLRNQ
ncbi:MAG: hypothetical protein FJ145_04820 [Deltaproteobacteria bacterium]|nr:hypothetical protein [Deltaproteobacteria bacterium]